MLEPILPHPRARQIEIGEILPVFGRHGHERIIARIRPQRYRGDKEGKIKQFIGTMRE